MPKPSHLINLGVRAAGRYKVRVLRADKSVRLETEWKKNLILNPGIREQDGHAWIGAVFYCRAGTGTTASKVTLDGTFSQSGTTVTRSTGTGVFSAGDVDKYIKFGTGEEHLILSFTSTTEVEVRDSETVAASTLEVYDTVRTALDAQAVSTFTLNGDAGANTDTRTISTGNIVRKRTFDFVVETGTVNYNEVGISRLVGNDLFSRIVLSSTVTVNSGEQLQVVYELSLTCSTWLALTPLTPVITNWPWEYTNTGFTSTGSDFTVTTDENHHYSAGDEITIAGVTPAGYNGTWTIASVGAATITVADASDLGVDSVPGTLKGSLSGEVRLKSSGEEVPFDAAGIADPGDTTNYGFAAVQEAEIMTSLGLGSGISNPDGNIHASRGYVKGAMDSDDFSWTQEDEWDIDEANWTDLRQIYFHGYAGTNKAAIVFTFDQNQRKDSGYSLRWGWKCTFRQDLP